MSLDRLFGLGGKSALVIGSTPIGVATVELLREAGAACDLADPEPDEAAMILAVDSFVAKRGKIDILVYAATRIGTYPLADLTAEQWDRIQHVNLRGAFIAIRQAVRHMRNSGGGAIVAVSTMGSLHPVLNGNAAYGASKAGLNALIRSVALDHHADGIRANCVLPGAVPVGDPPADMIRMGGPATQEGRMILGMASAQEIAGGILYLASPAGRFITGQSLTMDGGFLIS